jgi:hypothetical protein
MEVAMAIDITQFGGLIHADLPEGHDFPRFYRGVHPITACLQQAAYPELT